MFFIQNERTISLSNIKSIPRSGRIYLRYISPCEVSVDSLATSISKRAMVSEVGCDVALGDSSESIHAFPSFIKGMIMRLPCMRVGLVDSHVTERESSVKKDRKKNILVFIGGEV